MFPDSADEAEEMVRVRLLKNEVKSKVSVGDTLVHISSTPRTLVSALVYKQSNMTRHISTHT